MQAIGTLERAVGRLEQEVAGLTAVTASPSTASKIDVPGAQAALRSLDDLIADLKGRSLG